MAILWFVCCLQNTKFMDMLIFIFHRQYYVHIINHEWGWYVCRIIMFVALMKTLSYAEKISTLSDVRLENKKWVLNIRRDFESLEEKYDLEWSLGGFSVEVEQLNIWLCANESGIVTKPLFPEVDYAPCDQPTLP